MTRRDEILAGLAPQLDEGWRGGPCCPNHPEGINGEWFLRRGSQDTGGAKFAKRADAEFFANAPQDLAWYEAELAKAEAVCLAFHAWANEPGDVRVPQRDLEMLCAIQDPYMAWKAGRTDLPE